MKVLLDTNFLLMPNQFGIDIFEYLKFYDVFTLSQCVDELKKLSKGKGKDGRAARIGLDLIKKNDIEVVKSPEKTTDRAILAYAVRENCMVGTNDKELIKALKKKGIKIIRLKQKKYLVEE